MLKYRIIRRWRRNIFSPTKNIYLILVDPKYKNSHNLGSNSSLLNKCISSQIHIRPELNSKVAIVKGSLYVIRHSLSVG